MSEVLRFEYHASTDSFLAELDAVRKAPNGQTVTVVGVPRPAVHITLAELYAVEPDLVVRLREVLADLEPVLRKLADGQVASPERVQEVANEVAHARRALHHEKVDTKAFLDATKAEAARVAAATKKAEEEHQKRLDEMRAELAKLEVASAETVPAPEPTSPKLDAP